MSNTKTIVLCGVGGQGTITAADLLARAATEAGYSVKVSEIHGMAQRGGAVTTVVRFGSDVATMVADKGCADCVMAFESTEALRNLPYLKEDGFLLVSDVSIKPLPVACGQASMVSNLNEKLAEASAVMIDAAAVAQEIGNAKCENVVLLGALETSLGFGRDVWVKAIEGRVPPKTVESNLLAFDRGFSLASNN